MDSSSQAFFWWNKIIQSNNNNDQIPPKSCPSVSQMIIALIQISPPLVILYENTKDDQIFWNRLTQIIRELTHENSVPSPISEFDDFVVFLFDHQSQLEIKTSEKIILLFNLLDQDLTHLFFLWRVPEIFSDPQLYIETLYLMKIIRHPTWRKYTTTPGNVDMIFDRLIPLISINSPQVLIELTVSLFVEKIGFITNQLEIADQLFNQFIKIISAELSDSSKYISMIISAFRAASFIFILTQGRFNQQHHWNWASELLSSILNQSNLTQIGLSFLIKHRPNKFSKIKICQEIIQKIQSEDSLPLSLVKVDSLQFDPILLFYLTDLLLSSNPKKRPPLLSFFFEIGISHSFYRLTIIECLKKLLVGQKYDMSFKNTIGNLIKHCFDFIGLSTISNKYKNRRETIINFFDSLDTLEIDFINKPLRTFYSSLIASGKIMPQGVRIKDNDDIDLDFIHNLDSLTKKPFNLKQILIGNYPFKAPRLATSKSATPVRCFPHQRSNSIATVNKISSSKSRAPNSQHSSVFFFNKHKNPQITSPHPQSSKTHTARTSSMTQSKSTGFHPTKSFYRK